MGPQVLIIYGQCRRPVFAFYLGDNEFSVVGAQDGCGFADAGRAHVFLDGGAGIGHIDSSQFFGRKEDNLFVIFILEQRAEFLIPFDVDGAIAMSARQDASLGKGLINFVVETLVVCRMMSQPKTNRTHHRHEMR